MGRPSLKGSSRNQEIVRLYLTGLSSYRIANQLSIGVRTVLKILSQENCTIRPRTPDLVGMQFSKLTVLNPSSDKHKKGIPSYWDCLCSCGNYTKASTYALHSGHKRSCGCLILERVKECNTIHGQSRKNFVTPEYKMWNAAKARSREENVPFNIKVTDIIIPEYCPVLGIKLERHKKRMEDNSPTLDKIIPSKGYVKGNIEVISLRANKIKSDASIEEIEKVACWLKGKLNASS